MADEVFRLNFPLVHWSKTKIILFKIHFCNKTGGSKVSRGKVQHRYANIELICNNAERKVAVANIIFEVFFFTMQAVKGQGIDRHLLGLKLIALENNMKVPALHMDVAYSLSSHHNVSTSQVIKPIKWWITCAIKWKFDEKCIKCW